jgi:hypothetical protein
MTSLFLRLSLAMSIFCQVQNETKDLTDGRTDFRQIYEKDS